MSVLLYTLPFMWLSFGQTALLSLLSNLVLIPLAQVAMIAALLMLLFTPLPYLVYACAVVVSGTTGGMLWLVEKFSALGAPIVDLTGPLTCVAIAGVLLLFGVHFLLQRQRLECHGGSGLRFLFVDFLCRVGSGAGERLPLYRQQLGAAV